ncbi:MAG: hypothetical protein IT350_04290, partial [Deltaproteobacteria bacterium]|nr:hypothetical protein [Deltaproteobacteria bacterium]
METRTTVTFFLLIALAAFPACDCESPDSSDEASAKSDDDSSLDDDSLNDDLDDDAGSTTTTTSPTTTTTTAPPTSSSTTTTVVTTTSTSTTTTTVRPGTGTVCDPFNKVPEVIVPAVPYGPWPEWERDGVTFQQILSGGAGFGQNDIAISSDGVIHAVGQDGLSLDHYMIDAAGGITRDTINPLGGEWKVMDIDAEDHIHLVYTYRREPDEEVNELRYATNKSGEWEDILLREVDRGSPDFDMAVDANGLLHIVYSGIARNDKSLYYATWDGATLTETQLAPDDTTWRYGCYIALDSADEPHIIATDDFGLFAWDLYETETWVKTLVDADQASWDFGFDDQDRRHIVSNGITDGDLYHGVYENDVWTWEDIDDCRDGIRYPKLFIDAAGALHIVYTNGYGTDVFYTTNESGDWVFTRMVTGDGG